MGINGVMTRNLSAWLKTLSKSTLVKDLSYLYVLQIANYVVPLITIPYLIRVLGVEKFGAISFALAFMQYFVIIIDYGFNYTATRYISIHRNDNNRINRECCIVFSVKIILLLLSLLIVTTVTWAVPKMRADVTLYLVCFVMVIGNYIFPAWLFQGLEKIKYIAIINFVTKVIFTLSIFFFIKKMNIFIIIYIPIIINLVSQKS